MKLSLFLLKSSWGHQQKKRWFRVTKFHQLGKRTNYLPLRHFQKLIIDFLVSVPDHSLWLNASIINVLMSVVGKKGDGCIVFKRL